MNLSDFELGSLESRAAARSLATNRFEQYHKFTPREYQRPVLEALKTYRRAIIVWHRRAGKDRTFFNALVEEARKFKGVYYYFFPTYAQGKKIIWDTIDPKSGLSFLDHAAPWEKSRNNSEMKLTLKNDSLIQIIGTDHFDSIVGTNPRGTVWSEYALQDPRAWDYIRPILRENKGFAWFGYTPRGPNHGKVLWEMAEANPAWFTQKLTIDDTRQEDGTPVITLEEYMAEIDEGMDADLAKQEYYCSFQGAMQGSYYGTQMEALEAASHITKIEYDPRLATYTFWDLGFDDSMTIWFMQPARTEYRFIDYIEDHGKGFQWYIAEMNKKPYLYAGHYFPHDMEVHELTADGKSRLEVIKTLGLKNCTVNPNLDLEDGIQQVRGVLPLCWFDKINTKRGVLALKSYHKKWDEKKKVFLTHPEHDWSSHGADSFRTFAVGYKEKGPERPRKPQEHRGQGGWMR